MVVENDIISFKAFSIYKKPRKKRPITELCLSELLPVTSNAPESLTETGNLVDLK